MPICEHQIIICSTGIRQLSHIIVLDVAVEASTFGICSGRPNVVIQPSHRLAREMCLETRPVLTRPTILNNSYVWRHSYNVPRRHAFSRNEALGRFFPARSLFKPTISGRGSAKPFRWVGGRCVSRRNRSVPPPHGRRHQAPSALCARSSGRAHSHRSATKCHTSGVCSSLVGAARHDFRIDVRTFVDGLINSSYAFPTYNFSPTNGCEKMLPRHGWSAEAWSRFSKCLSIVDCNGTSLALQRRTFGAT